MNMQPLPPKHIAGMAHGIASLQLAGWCTAVSTAHIMLRGARKEKTQRCTKLNAHHMAYISLQSAVCIAYSMLRAGAKSKECDAVQGAAGIADLLFGKVSPSGKLPVTFYYNNYTDIQSMSNMDMRSWPGRTYRQTLSNLYGCIWVVCAHCGAPAGLCCVMLCCVE